MCSIGERLKYLRKEILGLTQEELGKIFNITKSGISLLELNQRTLSSKHINALYNLYGVNKSWLKYGTGDVFMQVNEHSKPFEFADTSSTFLHIELLLEYMKRIYHLSSTDISLINTYINLPENERQNVQSYVATINKPRVG